MPSEIGYTREHHPERGGGPLVNRIRRGRWEGGGKEEADDVAVRAAAAVAGRLRGSVVVVIAVIDGDASPRTGLVYVTLTARDEGDDVEAVDMQRRVQLVEDERRIAATADAALEPDPRSIMARVGGGDSWWECKQLR